MLRAAAGARLTRRRARARQNVGDAPPPLAYVVDTSTNGTFLNGQKITKHARVALADGDLLCLSSPDLSFDKTVAFRFCAYDIAAQPNAVYPWQQAAAAATSIAQPSAKRPRPSAIAQEPPIAAVELHAANMELRQRNAELEQQAATVAAKAASDVAAAAAKLAALQDELAALHRTTRLGAEEAEQTMAAERAKAEARVQEAANAVEAEKVRAAAAVAAVTEVENEAVAARAERDAALASVREKDAELEAARAKLENVQQANRAALRDGQDGLALLREELASRDAALTAERADKEAAQRRVERAAAELEAAAAALQTEREKRLAAEADAAKAQEKAAAAELQAARLLEESRGMREGGQLDVVLQDHLIQFARSVHVAAAAVMPHAEALAHKRAHAGAGPVVLRAGVPAHAAEPERPTQQVPHSAPPPPQQQPVASDTQHLERPVAVAPHCAPSTMLHGSLGMPMFSEMDDVQPHQPLQPVAEGMTDDIPSASLPSASLQAEIEAADATEAAIRARQSRESLSQRAGLAAMAGGNTWAY